MINHRDTILITVLGLLAAALGACTLSLSPRGNPSAEAAPSALPGIDATLPSFHTGEITPVFTPVVVETLAPTPTPGEVFETSIVFSSLRDGTMRPYFLTSDARSVSGLALPDGVAQAVWPEVSPDGTRIAFAAVQGGRLEELGLFVTDLASGATTQITGLDGNHPHWSPDSTRIAYTCARGADICIVNADGSAQVNITADQPSQDSYPDWTLDERIVFMSDRDSAGGHQSEVYIMASDGSGIERLTFSGIHYNAYPAVSPDGTRIAYESDVDVAIGSELYVMQLDGTGVQRVTTDDVWNQNPVWSPDGMRLLFAAADSAGNVDLYEVPADASAAPFRLTSHEYEDGGLRLGHSYLPIPLQRTSRVNEAERLRARPVAAGSQPASNTILFAANASGCPDCLATGLYRVNPDGSGLAALDVEGLYPTWAPDNRRFAFVRGGEVYLAGADGSGVVQLTSAFASIGPITWAPNGSAILAQCQPFSQYDICLIDPQNGAVNNLSLEITGDSGLPFPTWYRQDIFAGQLILRTSGDVAGAYFFPGRFSPDGGRIVTVRERSQIYVLDVTNRVETILDIDPSSKGPVAWSPDGGFLLYSSAPGDGRVYLNVVNVSGSGALRLVAQPIAAGPADLDGAFDGYLGYGWAQ